VAHLADAEIVISWRMRCILAAPGTPHPGLRSGTRGPRLGNTRNAIRTRLLRQLRAAREANLALYKSLAPEQWENASACIQKRGPGIARADCAHGCRARREPSATDRTHPRSEKRQPNDHESPQSDLPPPPDWALVSCPPPKPSPKRCCPLVDKPIIQYGVEEALAAGCDQIIIITGTRQERDRGSFRR